MLVHMLCLNQTFCDHPCVSAAFLFSVSIIPNRKLTRYKMWPVEMAMLQRDLLLGQIKDFFVPFLGRYLSPFQTKKL